MCLEKTKCCPFVYDLAIQVDCWLLEQTSMANLFLFQLINEQSYWESCKIKNGGPAAVLFVKAK